MFNNIIQVRLVVELDGGLIYSFIFVCVCEGLTVVWHELDLLNERGRHFPVSATHASHASQEKAAQTHWQFRFDEFIVVLISGHGVDLIFRDSIHPRRLPYRYCPLYIYYDPIWMRLNWIMQGEV